jgi:rare lipoprotein A
MRLSKTLTCAVFASGFVALMGGTAQAEPFQTGEASWYGPGFHGRKTANGERFNTNELTAAHKTLPFGTKVKVTNKQTGESVVVRINDRGPFAKDRVIDLSKASAQAIGISGVARVTLARL